MLANRKPQLRGDLNLDSLQTTFKNGTDKLANGNQDGAMACLNLAVEEINTKLLMTILLHRAAVHERRGNFELARRDAYSAIAYAKHVVDGYIFAYNIHLLEHKFKDAYDVIQEGLKYVPKTVPEYPMLVYLKDNAQAELDNRNAWRLPYRIVSIILDKLDFVDRIRLASTCMYWRKLLYHSSSGAMWSRFNLSRSSAERDSFINLFKTASRKSIQRVEIGTTDIVALIHQSQWQGIEHLEVSNVLLGDLRLIDTVSRNMATLKELSLVNVHPLGQGGIEQTLNEVLMYIPNLTKFALRFSAYSEAFKTDVHRSSRIYSLPVQMSPLPLTHLSLTEIRYLGVILPHCFNLRYIELLEQDLTGSSPEIFNLVDIHCPNLISFRYGTCEHGIKSPVDELPGDSSSARQWAIPPHENGLRELTYLPQKLMDQNVVRTIRSNLATLEILRLNLSTLGGFRLYVVHSLAADLHKTLRELELRGRHVQFGSGVTNTSADAVCELLNVCSNLETLSLDYIDILNDNLYHVVGSHSKIRRLFIRGYIRFMCDHGRPLHQCGLPVMFEKTKTLEDFYLESIFGGIDISSYFRAMSAHQGLRRVHLKCSGDMNISGTHLMANVLNRLVYLGLECAQNMTLPEMTFLHLLPRLTWLKLRSGTPVTKLTDEIITTLFYKRRENNATSLQISVYEEELHHARLYWSKTMEKNEKIANKVVFPSTSLIDHNDPSHMHTIYHNERERVAKVIGTWSGKD